MFYRILFTCGLLALLQLPLLCQAPGGVGIPSLWFLTEAREDGRSRWVSPLGKGAPEPPSSPTFNDGPGSRLNGYPALRFDGEREAIPVPLPGQAKEQACSIFLVYHSADSLQEQTLWGIKGKEGTQQLMTTHRTVDLRSFHYMNYPGQGGSRPKLIFYFQGRTQPDHPRTDTLLWGGMPERTDLPVQPFEGILPEWVVYDRVLSTTETERVETYLALKYGITLRRPQPADYLDSRAKVIWNGKKNAAFHHRVAGLGRDDASGLQQRKATSSEAPGQVALSVVPDTDVPDRSFLLWGDNGRPPQWDSERPGQPVRLQRQWLLQTSGEGASLKTRLTIHPKGLFDPPLGEERYWLVVDSSGEGNFQAADVNYFPLSRQGGSLVADSLFGLTGAGETSVFSLAKGPDMLVHASPQAPPCGGKLRGRIDLKVAGGQPPFRVSLSRPGSPSFSTLLNDPNSFHAFPDLEAGRYELTLEDRNGRSYQEEIILESVGGPDIPLADTYRLPHGEHLSLRASTDPQAASRKFFWEGPGGFSSELPEVEILEAGPYSLTVEENGCLSYHPFLVKAGRETLFRRAEILPNPVYAGHPFRINVELPESQSVEMRILDANGRLVLSRSRAGQRYYQFAEVLKSPGVYLIQLRSSDAYTTLRLIVQS